MKQCHFSLRFFLFSGLLSLLICVLTLSAPSALALSASPLVMRGGSASAQPQPACQDYSTCFKIGVQAYIYAYPLVMTGVTEAVATNVPNATTKGGRAPINQFTDFYGFLPTAAYTDIVLPNVNTPYSNAWLDLSKEPIILHLPDLGNRFFLMESMDAWTNVIPNSPGTRTAAGPGNYAYVGPDWKGTLPSGLTEVLHFPTNTVLILGRTYSTGSQADLAQVAAIQSQYTLTPLDKFGKPYSPPTHAPVNPNLDMSAPFSQVDKMDAGTFFSMFAELMRSNPPLLADSAEVAELAKIGLVPGQPFQINSLDPVTRQALQDAVQAGNTIVTKTAGHTSPTSTNWNMNLNLGAYGTQYLLRAAVARGIYGANYFKDAVYAFGLEDGNGQQLNGAHRYTLTFNNGELPPANPQAFWSVTLYNYPAENLFANPINRNALGIPAVQDHLPCFNSDGSLTFYIQADQPDPATEPTQYCNWLPAPAGDFVLLMRIYWPGQTLFAGQWIPPAVQQAP